MRFDVDKNVGVEPVYYSRDNSSFSGYSEFIKPGITV